MKIKDIEIIEQNQERSIIDIKIKIPIFKNHKQYFNLITKKFKEIFNDNFLGTSYAVNCKYIIVSLINRNLEYIISMYTKKS